MPRPVCKTPRRRAGNTPKPPQNLEARAGTNPAVRTLRLRSTLNRYRSARKACALREASPSGQRSAAGGEGPLGVEQGWHASPAQPPPCRTSACTPHTPHVRGQCRRPRPKRSGLGEVTSRPQRVLLLDRSQPAIMVRLERRTCRQQDYPGKRRWVHMERERGKALRTLSALRGPDHGPHSHAPRQAWGAPCRGVQRSRARGRRASQPVRHDATPR